MVFINFSNHPSANWSEKQIKEAQKGGMIIDLAFPSVSSSSTESEILLLADKCVKEIISYHPSVVMCQGEFTLAFRVVTLLKEKGIDVVAACSERTVIEQIQPDGSSRKESVYRFMRFRKYI